MKHTDIKALLCEPDKYLDTQVTVCGWVRTARDSKNISFIELNDGTTLNNIQLIIEKDKDGIGELKDAMVVGASLKAVGKFIVSERNGYEMNIDSIILSKKSAILLSFCVLSLIFAPEPDILRRYLR